MASGSQKSEERCVHDSALTAGPSTSISSLAAPDAGPSEPTHSCDDDTVQSSSRNDEAAELVTELGYVPTFDGQEALPPSLVAVVGERRAAELLLSVAEDAVNVFAHLKVAKEFEGHRAVVQRAYGDERACATLRDFVRANTKVVPLNIWEHPPGDYEMYHLGSANPLTIYYVRCHAPSLRPETSDPSLIDFDMKAYSPIKHGAAIFRIGEWFCAGVPPEPIRRQNAAA